MIRLGIAVLLVGALSLEPASAQSGSENSGRESFVGTWTLVSWTAETADGQTSYPFGQDALGRISYDEAGRMSVQIMRRRRTKFSTEDPLGESPEEIMEAFHGFLAYYGTYRVDHDAGIVTHIQDVASSPNWVGAEATRYYELTGNTLTLSTAPVVSVTTGEQAARHRLVWERLP
jgi:hypothetical protein